MIDAAEQTQITSLPEESVAIKDLKRHPRNYRSHPEDQLVHLRASIEKHGMYRNIVIANDGTILAGHGVVDAARSLGLTEIAARRVDFGPEDVRALEILTGDNEIDHLGVIDDRALSELLKEIKDADIDGLIGTGYDDRMLANLAFVTRPKSEIATFDAAAHWAGMPDYDDGGEEPLKITVSFRTEEDRDDFVIQSKLRIDKREARTWSTWWPFRERDDLVSLKFTE
jgi:hypothetical protein